MNNAAELTHASNPTQRACQDQLLMPGWTQAWSGPSQPAQEFLKSGPSQDLTMAHWLNGKREIWLRETKMD